MATYCPQCDSEDCRVAAHQTDAEEPPLDEAEAGEETASASDSFLPPIDPDGGRNESGLVRVNGSEIASSEATEVETLTLLGREGYIQVEAATLISSYPKTGKTTLLKQLAREWAAQGHKVLIFTEEHRKTWELRIQDDSALWANVEFVFALGAGRDAILAEMKPSDEDVVDVVVVDTLRSCLGFRDEKDNSEVSRVVGPLINAARLGNKSFLGFTHETKEGGSHGRGIAMGHALLGVFDGSLELHRVPEVGNRRKVTCLARLLDPPELLYEKKEDGSLEALGAAHLVEKKEVERRVSDTLDEKKRTLNEIRLALGEPRPALTNVTKALEALVALGHAFRSGAGKRGDPYRWGASEQDPSDPDSFLPPGVSIGERNESSDSPEEPRERNVSDPGEGQISKGAGQEADSGSEEPQDSFLPPSSNEKHGERNESVSILPPIEHPW